MTYTINTETSEVSKRGKIVGEIKIQRMRGSKWIEVFENGKHIFTQDWIVNNSFNKVCKYIEEELNY